MKVTKRTGKLEEVSFDKVTKRLKKLCDVEPKLSIDVVYIAQKVVARIYDGVKTTELDELAARTCASAITEHPEYGNLASRIIISNNHKNTSPSFSETVYMLYNNKNIFNNHCPLIADDVFNIIIKNKSKLNDVIDYSRDFNFDYFAFKTLEKAYLMKINGKIIERIQHLIMRVSIGIHKEDIKKAIETYNLISSKLFTHATPTLFHAGSARPQLLSCFLMGMDDSIGGIYKALSDCAMISKWAGGIGIHASSIRSKNSIIRSTNGFTSGIVPMLRVFNETARYVNQSGKRNGSFAIYLEPWHADIMEFLELRKNHGDENARARDLFYALWIPDLFMKKVEKNEKWSLFCPDECKGLADAYGDKFEQLYNQYEKEGKFRKQINAREIWKSIITSQIETGTPYILYKNAANSKSNQQNLGTIRSSNLCTEIIEYSDDKEYACCTLASICLSKFIEPPLLLKENNLDDISVLIYSKLGCSYCELTKMLCRHYNIKFKTIIGFPQENTNSGGLNNKHILTKENFEKKYNTEVKTFPQIVLYKQKEDKFIGGYEEFENLLRPRYNYKKLYDVTKVVTRNLDNIIDINFYPVPETKLSNMRHRPLGIGVQGLADVYCIMRYPFDSQEASVLNKNIFATIYYASLTMSYELGKERGVYSTFANSPLSQGKLQFDLWNTEPVNNVGDNECNLNLNWNKLRKDIMNNGVRNSLLLAPMPTASTSQIMGNNECIEPFTSNIYTRRTIAGDFVVVNKYLLQDLINLGIWNEELKNIIIYYEGSIQKIDNIPKKLRNLYKTSWELKQKVLIDQAADRGVYVCQSQSLNLFLESPKYPQISSMHFYSWKKGLKTGIYYLRTKAVSKSQQFTIDPKLLEKIKKQKTSSEDIDKFSGNKTEVCEACSA